MLVDAKQATGRQTFLKLEVGSKLKNYKIMKAYQLSAPLLIDRPAREDKYLIIHFN